MSWIDISVPVTATGMPVWPGSPAPRFEARLCMAHGDGADDTNIHLSVHTGTHVDAPSHFVKGAKTVDQMGLGSFIGPCYVADCRGAPRIDAAVLDGAGIPEGATRLLLRTDNEQKWGPAFDESFVGLTPDASRWVVERGLRLIGVDYLSVQAYDQSDDVHKILLGAEVMVLEGLTLFDVTQGAYVLVCLPMNLHGIEGAPARALLFPDGTLTEAAAT